MPAQILTKLPKTFFVKLDRTAKSLDQSPARVLQDALTIYSASSRNDMSRIAMKDLAASNSEFHRRVAAAACKAMTPEARQKRASNAAKTRHRIDAMVKLLSAANTDLYEGRLPEPNRELAKLIVEAAQKYRPDVNPVTVVQNELKPDLPKLTSWYDLMLVLTAA